MGDAADLAIQQGMDEEDYRYEHPEEFEDENADCPPSPSKYKYKKKLKVCRQCGKGGFHWQKAKTGWRLFDKNNQIHNCNKKFIKGKERKRLVFTKEVDDSIDYTKDAEFWAKANPQALYWYTVKHPEKAKNMSRKACWTLANNLK